MFSPKPKSSMDLQVGVDFTVSSVDFSHVSGSAEGEKGGRAGGKTPGLPAGFTTAGVEAGEIAGPEAGEIAGPEAGEPAGDSVEGPASFSLLLFFLEFCFIAPYVIPTAMAATTTVIPIIMLMIFHFSRS